MSDKTSEDVGIRLILVDDGEYHRVDVSLPSHLLEGYDRLIDALLENPEILKRLYVDPGRLCAAYRKSDE